MTFLESNIDNSSWLLKNYFSYTYARIFLFLSLGILCGYYFNSNLYFIVFGITVVAILINIIFSTLFRNNLREWIFIVSFSLLLFSLGAILIVNHNEKVIVDMPVKESTYLIKVESIPVMKDKYCSFDAKVLFSFDTLCSSIQNHKVLLNLSVDSQLISPKLGDKYLVSTSLFLPNKDDVSSFDYSSYLKVNGYSKIGYVYDDIILYNRAESYSITEKFLLLRENLISIYRDFKLGNEELAILSAITLGEKSILSKDTKNNFSAAGVSHILVVSGMHVGFIFMIISLLYSRLYNRYYRLFVTIFGLVLLWLYALLTGFAPSVVRASFMFSLMLVFLFTGNKYRVLHALLLSATISLLANPALLFNISFQLSYLAVLSIVVFYKRIYHFLQRIVPKFKWRNNILSVICVTLAAQVFTFPIVMFYFHQFPLFFMISNLCVVLLAPIIFIGGYLLIFTSVIPYVSNVIAYILNIILKFFEEIINIIASLKYAVIDVYISLFQCILLYFIVLLFLNYLNVVNKNKNIALSAVLISVVVFVIVTSVNTIDVQNKNILYVGNRKQLMVNVFNCNDNILFVNGNNYYDKNELWIKYKAPYPKIINDSSLINNLFEFENESYLILRDNVFRYKHTNLKPIVVDNLIIDRGVYPSNKLFDQFVLPKYVILTNGVYSGYISDFKNVLQKRNIPYYVVSEQGSFLKIKNKKP